MKYGFVNWVRPRLTWPIAVLGMVVISEVGVFYFDLGKFAINAKYGEPIKTEIRSALVDQNTAKWEALDDAREAELDRLDEQHRRWVASLPSPAGTYSPVALEPLPTLKADDPFTLIDEPFVKLTEEQFADAKQAVTALGALAAQLANTKTVLPKGTHYIPCLKDSDDPASIVTAVGQNGQTGVLVNVWDERHRKSMHALIPDADYRVFLQKAKSGETP